MSSTRPSGNLRLAHLLIAGGLALAAVAGCSGGGAGDDEGGVRSFDAATSGARDLTAPTTPQPDLGGNPPPPDLSVPPGDPGDGTPTRQACSNSFGSALTTTHGRIDGYLVSTVPIGAHGCNGDRSHVHLQIRVQGAIYDAAVTMVDMNGGDVLFAERDHALPDGAWSEGWHPGAFLDYPSLGVRASDFAAMTPDALAQKVLGELQGVNHISVFATGYGPTGVHKVHRNGGGDDGAIVLRPLSGTPHLMYFHFANQSF